MNTMGINENDQTSIFKVIASILLLGNIDFVQPDDSPQAHIKDDQPVNKLCRLLDIDPLAFKDALLNPILRVGKESIVQSRDVEQVVYSIESLIRTMYERLFSWLVDRLNQTLKPTLESHPYNSKRTFIGVLDIAGFEIFERNSFEQLCINYTNEKLQQFYNHHMFIQEQEEYKKEHVEWSFDRDFGLDLQPTIDLLERSNPIGVFACLDEDCILPKATDKSFTEKMLQLARGNARMEPRRFGQGFTIQHYAGKVEYQTEGWLDKNKDPVNDGLLAVLATSSDSLISSIASSDIQSSSANSKMVKKGLFRTVAQRHRESLMTLMHELNQCRPHFVRCIVPNLEKKPLTFNTKLVLDQLKCNGVFEGIRVCRNGYPGRMPIDDFARLYRVLLPSDSLILEPRAVCLSVLEKVVGLQEGHDFKLGISKVFLKNGKVPSVLYYIVLTNHLPIDDTVG